jgi:hypothetical protein
MRQTFESGRDHARTIVAVQIFDAFAYQAHERAGMESIRRGRVDLYEIGKRRLALRNGLWIEEVYHQIAIFDAHHGVVVLHARMWLARKSKMLK